MNKFLFSLAIGTILSMSLANAADDPVGARQKLMKGMGGAMKQMVAIAKGEKPFDAAKVKAASEILSGNMEKALTHFPAGSNKGDTEALPKIWQTPDDFKAQGAKLITDSKALTTVASAADLGKALGVIGKDCKSCHDSYRKAD